MTKIWSWNNTICYNYNYNSFILCFLFLCQQKIAPGKKNKSHTSSKNTRTLPGGYPTHGGSIDHLQRDDWSTDENPIVNQWLDSVPSCVSLTILVTFGDWIPIGSRVLLFPPKKRPGFRNLTRRNCESPSCVALAVTILKGQWANDCHRTIHSYSTVRSGIALVACNQDWSWILVIHMNFQEKWGNFFLCHPLFKLCSIVML